MASGLTILNEIRGTTEMTYKFKIVATEDFSDHVNRIKFGDVLYETDGDEEYSTQYAAEVAADNTIAGLSGSPAFDAALKTAAVEVYEWS